MKKEMDRKFLLSDDVGYFDVKFNQKKYFSLFFTLIWLVNELLFRRGAERYE